MAELATVARPYAEALFRVAKDSQATSMNMDAWAALAAEMAQVARHPDVQAMAHNPNVPSAVVAETFTALLKSPRSPEADRFIAMLVENGRVALLPEIGAQFAVLKNAQQGSADADIISAFEISNAQVSELVAALEKKFGKKLNPSVTIDPSLIGGVRVVVGDEVLDTSVRAKLQRMQVALVS
jgi:F-type H+-transporting ATPase subunit delta